ncbi:hypothetical protein ABID56_001181 [Alkalibacillus flavidus]|uniref:Uncharacterized protein n=1 Tax=Alkalibacillus flavidus TaxID=546021 RepID=A0ABV2KU34_9BACI
MRWAIVLGFLFMFGWIPGVIRAISIYFSLRKEVQQAQQNATFE